MIQSQCLSRPVFVTILLLWKEETKICDFLNIGYLRRSYIVQLLILLTGYQVCLQIIEDSKYQKQTIKIPRQ